MEDSKIEMKDDYSQYLFYFVKQYDNPNNPIDYLKIQNLFDILENKENDEKMNTESDIEICEEYVQIITNFTNQLSNYIKEKKSNLKLILKDIIQVIKAENLNDKFEIVLIEDFIKKMKEIGIQNIKLKSIKILFIKVNIKKHLRKLNI